MKLCKDCKHVYLEGEVALCSAPEVTRKDVVYGGQGVTVFYCFDERTDADSCGNDARYYEPITPQEAKR